MVSNTKYVLGVLAAAAAGAVVGYIWAQEEDTPLGQRLKQTVGDWANQALEALKNRSDEGLNPEDNSQNRAYVLRDRAEEAEEEFRERIEFGFSRKEY